jgi:hypothetical protein
MQVDGRKLSNPISLPKIVPFFKFFSALSFMSPNAWTYHLGLGRAVSPFPLHVNSSAYVLAIL